ncbi:MULTISPECIES: alpha/beta hydrolase [Streptomyces]|uniref:alpha/beta hydrolase n=1 Tax=Streptomyces TaxID=1883 RepID=UPI0016775C26|nr:MULTISPECIES: alpha/beta hydrolase [Streptomyces]MBK3520629.1 alpha/beta hydrolase [Streptomyces sp. MBT70]GGR58953.1 esterase [Streptomyces eurythermus]
MLLDPELAAVAASLPRTDLTDPVAVRETALAAARAAVAALPADDAVQITDLETSGPRVRLYRPADAPAPAPVLLDFHGGAFVMGSVDSEHRRALDLARRTGFVVISVDYRLAPEHPFPAGLEDCYEALCWTVKNATELGVDPDRLAVVGGSAGGGLAAAVTLLSRDRGGPSIAFQLLICPALDDRMRTRSAATFTDVPAFDSAAVAQMWPHYIPARAGTATELAYAAPARAEDLSGLPAAYIVTAEHDPLRDEGNQYALRLLDAGVPVELHHVPGTFHVFDHVAPDADVSRRARAEMAAALVRAL